MFFKVLGRRRPCQCSATAMTMLYFHSKQGATHAVNAAQSARTLPCTSSWARTPRGYSEVRLLSVTKHQSSPPVVVVGSVNADLVVPITRLPRPGETLGASGLELLPGGKGANQAAAAAQLGSTTYFVGQVGTDANAEVLRQALQQCGVDVSALRTVDGPSGTALILLQPGGENSIIIVGGANQTRWNISDSTVQLIQSAGVVLLQREIPEDVNVRVAQLAQAAGVPVVLDAGGVDAPLSPDLLQHVSLFSPNETELARMTDMPTTTEAQVVAAARQVMECGVDTVLVKRGREGSMLVQRQSTEPLMQPCVPAPQVVDTTGAGDCFTAAFAVAQLQGQSHTHSLRFAAAASSLCVQRKGAMPSMPSGEEVQQLLQSTSR